MTDALDRPVVVAAAIAVVLHLFLFIAVRPSNGNAGPEALAAPGTRYLAQASGGFPMSGAEVRTVRSPVIFSLPSGMGFSRDLLERRVQTPRFLLPQPGRDSFVEVDLSAHAGGEYFVSEELMVAAKDPAPGLPSGIFRAPEKRTAPRRVHLAPELKERLEGGIVLPAELNRPAATPWEVHASLNVSEQGGVKHVFLDRPLESAALNQRVLQLLYGLRFKAGRAVDGAVEIYSPESAGAGAEK